MTVVCLDTQIVQWGVLRRASDQGQQHLVDRSTALLELIEKNNDSVILPSIVVGELLVPVPLEEQGEVLKRLRNEWIVVDYDSFAALQFARMRHGRPTAETLKELQKTDPSATRNELIADTMIAATALAHRATRVYTNDRRFRNSAGNYIEITLLDEVDLPDEQLGLDLPESDSGR